MEDKRRRVRVQGGWAGPARNQASGKPGLGAKGSPQQGLGQNWMKSESHLPERQFVYKEPKEEVLRRIPDPQVIDKEGVYEISISPTGTSRIRLFPNFIDSEEADWIFEQLCQDIPWKQRTGNREGMSYLQPRLTAWYGELPYTYSRITMEPNPQWHPVLSMLKSRIEESTGHTFNSLLCNLYRNDKDSVDWHSDDEPSLGRCPVIASLSLGATRTFEMRKKPPAVLSQIQQLLVSEECAVDRYQKFDRLQPKLNVNDSGSTVTPTSSFGIQGFSSFGLGNFNSKEEENGDYTYVEKVKIPLDHGTLLMMEGATQADWQHRVPKEYHSKEARVNLTFRTVFSEPSGMDSRVT